MIRVGIVGSCVTRDAFSYISAHRKEISLEFYFARTSLISITSPPLALSGSTDFGTISGFEKKCLIKDFSKTFLFEIENSNVDVVIFDFIDERYPIISLNNTFISKTSGFDKTKIQDTLPKDHFVIEKNSDKALSFWSNSLHAIRQHLNSLDKIPTIMMHDAPFAKILKTSSQLNVSHDKNLHGWIDRMNAMMGTMATLAHEKFENSHLIRVPDILHVADEMHKWGPMPFHYIDSYYEEFSKLFLLKI